MSKFWQKKYISKYTGAEIDAAVAKAGDLSKVVANPTLAGTESALEGLQVGNTKYKVGANYPVFELTDEEFAEVSDAFSTFLYGLTAASGLVYKDFTILTNAATVIAKIKAVVNSGKPFVQYKLPASFAGASLFGSVGSYGFNTFVIPFAFPAPINKYINISFEYSYAQGEASVIITVGAHVITAAS